MAQGFQILKPYGKIIGHWKEKPISVDVDQKCVACGLDAIEVDDRMFDFLLGLDDESAVTAVVYFVREGRKKVSDILCAVEKCDREIRSLARAERPRRNHEGE